MRLKRTLLARAADAIAAAMRIAFKSPPAGEIEPRAASLALMESVRAAPEVAAPPSG